MPETATLSAFKAYDVRGRYPKEINTNLAWHIGNALVTCLQARTALLGRDPRLSSPALSEALADGMVAAGAKIFDLGDCATEELHFALAQPDVDCDCGAMVTASHNSSDYNGIKFALKGGYPLLAKLSMAALKKAVAQSLNNNAISSGNINPEKIDTRPAFLQHMVDLCTPFTTSLSDAPQLVVDCGYGSAALFIDELIALLPFPTKVLRGKPDGNFPDGAPNPMLAHQREPLIEAVKASKALLGSIWDGDADRCFFVDEGGQFVPGYYIAGLLSNYFLSRNPQETIVHDPRLFWNTLELIQQHRGNAVESLVGHNFMKQTMREHNAIYGGEISCHHYFRDFYYCDSGILPWLLITSLCLSSAMPLSELVAPYQEHFPASDELNFTVDSTEAVTKRVKEFFHADAQAIYERDGLSMEFSQWRFNLRPSNTEPLLRLNLETRQAPKLLQEKTEILSNLISP